MCGGGGQSNAVVLNIFLLRGPLNIKKIFPRTTVLSKNGSVVPHNPCKKGDWEHYLKVSTLKDSKHCIVDLMP
jgi:hypothetical protein